MSNSFFKFKQFIIHQERCAMKVTTDACLFGAFIAEDCKRQQNEIKTVLDIGTGTGLLSLMFAQKNHLSAIQAVEIEKDAAEQAKENIELSPWKGKIEIIHSDIRKRSFPGKFDLIISNPPFYENELKSEKEIRNIALHSHELPLNELVEIIKTNLSATGNFYLLLPYKRQDEIKKLILEKELQITKLVLVKQSAHHSYFRIILSGKQGQERETAIEEISVWDDKQEYTREFTELLKDYYLYL